MDRIDQTLAEQIRLDKHQLDYRKRLLKFEKDDALLLKSIKPYIKIHIDQLVEDFYSHQREFREITSLIGDLETMRRLKLAMRDYILELFDGKYDELYVNKRLRVGKVHKRIGVSPKLYLASMRELETILKNAVSSISVNELSQDTKKKVTSALEKLITFDTQFVLDTYIESLINEVQDAKLELLEYANSLEETIAERTSELKRLSIEDNLTGLYNQRYFHTALRKELARAEREKSSITLAYMDIDNFKQVNDSHGHQNGDRILEELGVIIKSELRVSDIPCRYGGDEFCIICPNTDKEGATQILERIIEKFTSNQKEAGVDLSVGITSTGPTIFETAETLIRFADTAMYMSKERSKTAFEKHQKVVFFDVSEKNKQLKEIGC